MRILVTGGAGFIGSHVVDAYIAAGHEVAVLDDLSSGKRENLPADVPIYVGSTQDKVFVRQVVEEFQPEVINHHAAQISVTASVRDSFADAEANVMGMNAILIAMIEYAPQAKLIYASSGGAMYGVYDEVPYTETSTPLAHSPYGLSKYVAEQYVWLYARLHNLRATVLRYANVFGPRQDPHGEAGVCAIFADRMMSGQPVTIFGDGKATRDYVYVKDVARANLAALEKGDGESFNIATGVETSTNQVFSALAQAFGYSEEPERAPLRAGEASRSVLNAAKAERTLRWKAKVPFETAAAETAAWYQAGQQYMALKTDDESEAEND
jgi:UDP-glucose 4-epimerase